MYHIAGLLCSFLKFVTSSDIIVTDTIQVSFTTITGAGGQLGNGHRLIV